MGGSGESGTAGAKRLGKSPSGIIARKQRARYNAALPNFGAGLPGKVHLETLSDPLCGSRAPLRIARALGLSRRRAELSVQADPPASPLRGGHRRGGAPARVQVVSRARRAGAARAAL